MAFNKNPKVVTKYIDDFEYVSTNETGNEVLIDMYDGSEKSHQSPTELLLSALASCAAVDVVEILKKRRKSFSSFTVEARGDRKEDHPRYFDHIDLHFNIVSSDVKEAEVLKSAKMVVEKYCSVASTVDGKASIAVSTTIHSE